MKKIDSHQHFWRYASEKHSWITDQMKALKQDFMPPDLEKEMEEVGMEGCIAVQAEQTETETQFLLVLAEEFNFIKGVIGWLDIRANDFEEKLNQYTCYEYFKGLRHIVQDESDDQFLLRRDFLKGIGLLGKFNLAYDILIYAPQLPIAIKFANKFPDQKFVLNHIAKPEIKKQKIDEWKKGIRELAQHPEMYCKISGMVTEADWKYWDTEDFKPYLDLVFDVFGSERLMFGSDWPVCTLAARYEEVYQLLYEYIQQLSEEEQRMIMGSNAQTFYNL